MVKKNSRSRRRSVRNLKPRPVVKTLYRVHDGLESGMEAISAFRRPLPVALGAVYARLDAAWDEVDAILNHYNA